MSDSIVVATLLSLLNIVLSAPFSSSTEERRILTEESGAACFSISVMTVAVRCSSLLESFVSALFDFLVAILLLVVVSPPADILLYC